MFYIGKKINTLNKKTKSYFLVSLFFLFALFLIVSFNQVFASMSASIYKIESDSINSGGNDISIFGDIQMADTVGEIAIGDSMSTSYAISAGYRSMDETSVSIGLSLQDVILAPDLGGLTGGTSNGATQVTVTTDNPAGYLLSIQASDAPAMRSVNSIIPDYVPLVVAPETIPDFLFRVVVATSSFAFTPEGVDITDLYRDSGGICNVLGGNDTASRCWNGLSLVGLTISNRSHRTDPLLGSTTTIRFSVGIGGGGVQSEGSYSATTTITAFAL